jgi:hypothetical protein
MADPAPNTQLLRSLGRLVRGLSALFWGLPCALVVCFYTARAEGFDSFGILPPMVCTGWLVYGLWNLGAFQKQERVWRNALDRAIVLGLINFGLSPFLHWSSRLPSSFFFLTMVLLLALTGVLFLASLNQVLQRLGAMLPDEALRLEIKQFTGVNINLLRSMLLLAGVFVAMGQFRGSASFLGQVIGILDHNTMWFLIPLVPLVLLPLAMTMALLWKTKEVILDSVFGANS